MQGDKHSILLRKFVNYGHKKICNIVPGRTAVEASTHKPKMDRLQPANGIGREKISKKLEKS
jgi:hypothetical protein